MTCRCESSDTSCPLAVGPITNATSKTDKPALLCRFIELLPVYLLIPRSESATSLAPWAQGPFATDEDLHGPLSRPHLFPWTPVPRLYVACFRSLTVE